MGSMAGYMGPLAMRATGHDHKPLLNEKNMFGGESVAAHLISIHQFGSIRHVFCRFYKFTQSMSKVAKVQELLIFPLALGLVLN
jgi:hypothetical protein